MPKKSGKPELPSLKAKTSKVTQKPKSSAAQNSASSPNLHTQSINDLFATAKKTKKTRLKEEERSKKEKILKKRRRKAEDDGWIIDEYGEKIKKNGDTGRYTEDGFKIYKAHALNCDVFGDAPQKGGGTPDCPFDCQCCF